MSVMFWKAIKDFITVDEADIPWEDSSRFSIRENKGMYKQRRKSKKW